MFRCELGLMPGLVRAVAAGDGARAAIVADHVVLITGALAAHHRGEDDHLWPVLRERCPEQCAPLVAVMTDQHYAIHERFAPVEKAAESWRRTASTDTRDALAETVEQLRRVTTEHLVFEEERVVPLIEEYLTESEYAKGAQEARAAIPSDLLPMAIGMTIYIYEGDPGGIEVIVRALPAGFEDRGAAAYAAYAEKVYGTATPPRATD